MTEQQKKYIEANIDLIENDKWKEFFKNAPRGTGEVLYFARIDFMTWMKQVPPECFRGSALTSITVPNNVTSIGHYAFAYCRRLKSITISSSMINIKSDAFNSIESDVVINFNGTKQQWKNLISDDIAVFKNTRYTCNCVDGAVRKSR